MSEPRSINGRMGKLISLIGMSARLVAVLEWFAGSFGTVGSEQ